MSFSDLLARDEIKQKLLTKQKKAEGAKDASSSKYVRGTSFLAQSPLGNEKETDKPSSKKLKRYQ